MIVKLTLSSPEQPEDREIWIHAAHIVHFAADARGGTFLRTTKPEPLWCSESPDSRPLPESARR